MEGARIILPFYSKKDLAKTEEFGKTALQISKRRGYHKITRLIEERMDVFRRKKRHAGHGSNWMLGKVRDFEKESSSPRWRKPKQSRGKKKKPRRERRCETHELGSASGTNKQRRSRGEKGKGKKKMVWRKKE